MQQTFGTTVSTADSVSAVRNEAPYECHEQRANFDVHLSHSCVFCVFEAHDTTSFVIDRNSRNNIIPRWSCDVVR